mmetsp:Transcript_12858/g.32583  ORF Transcript_12858/g.32583 Transcript_12858/m.32583 type:complete len:323 (+) Transcript_12858:1001-1969(+)
MLGHFVVHIPVGLALPAVLGAPPLLHAPQLLHLCLRLGVLNPLRYHLGRGLLTVRRESGALGGREGVGAARGGVALDECDGVAGVVRVHAELFELCLDVGGGATALAEDGLGDGGAGLALFALGGLLHERLLLADVVELFLGLLVELEILIIFLRQHRQSRVLLDLELLQPLLDIRVDKVRDILPVHDLRNNIIRPLGHLEIIQLPIIHRIHPRAAILLHQILLGPPLRPQHPLHLHRVLPRPRHRRRNIRRALLLVPLPRLRDVQPIQHRRRAVRPHLLLHALRQQHLARRVLHLVDARRVLRGHVHDAVRAGGCGGESGG